jgi:4-nitrophenyl phosphatase
MTGSRPRVRAVISDLDGVVYFGRDPIATAVGAIQGWQARGIGVAFVTNNSSRSATAVAEKLAGLGVVVDPFHVLTAGEALATHIAVNFTSPRVFAIGEPVLYEALECAGAMLVADEDAEIVALGMDRDLSYRKLDIAVRALLGGARLIVTNPDLLTPADGGFSPCVGAIMALMTATVPRAPVTVIGKPEPGMMREAMRRLGVAADEVVMVGDQVATDVAAGRAAGIRSFLVATGIPLASQGELGGQSVIDSLHDLPID